LLLNPMSSIWALIGGEVYCDTCDFYESPEALPETKNYDRIRNIDSDYSDLIRQLTASRIEYLITDEYYLNNMSISEDSKFVSENHSFSSIILPDLFCLNKETASNILAFANNGGKVFYTGELPIASTDNGLNDEEFISIIKKIKNKSIKLTNIKEQLDSHVDFIAGEFPMKQIHRIIDGKHFFWFVNNTDYQQTCKVNMNEYGTHAYKWDCEDGSIIDLETESINDELHINLTFNPYEAYWVVLDSTQKIKKNNVVCTNKLINQISLNSRWKVSIDTLDQPVKYPGQKSYPEYLEIVKGERDLNEWEFWGMQYFTGYVDYYYEFRIDTLQNVSTFILDLGTVYYMAEVELNGKKIGNKLWPPFLFDLSDEIIEGENQLKIKVGNLLINYMNKLIETNQLKSDPFYLKLRPKNYIPKSGLIGPVILSEFSN